MGQLRPYAGDGVTCGARTLCRPGGYGSGPLYSCFPDRHCTGRRGRMYASRHRSTSGRRAILPTLLPVTRAKRGKQFAAFSLSNTPMGGHRILRRFDWVNRGYSHSILESFCKFINAAVARRLRLVVSPPIIEETARVLRGDLQWPVERVQGMVRPVARVAGRGSLSPAAQSTQ